MKKVIVAAAGLALVGTMATSAMAEFKFSGDARARFYLQSDYDDAAFGNATASDDDTRWNSRTRFKIEADTKGGAYVKTRVRLSEGSWDGTANTRNKNNNIYTDYAYIGVPFGPVTVEAGLVPRDITPWFFLDGRSDAVQVKYKNDMTSLVAFYDIVDEEFSDIDDDDIYMYGAVLNQGFSGGWNAVISPIYVDDNLNSDSSGFGATAQVNGALSNVALTAELSYKEADLQGTDDDGFGGYLSATVPVGSVELLGMVGFTSDGFEMDAADFGPFIMLNDYSQISTAFNFAEFGDSFFAAIAPTFKATEKLTLGAQASVADVDNDFGDDFTAWEIGATASYAVTDGAKLNGILGYLDTDDITDDNPVGFGLSLEISF